MKTVYTALVGNYEELKEPTVITPGWKYVCYTDQNITSATWQIKKIDKSENPSRTAREIKLLFHKYVKTKYSLWVDASFRINCDLNHWWQRFHAPFTVIQHPMRKCVYEEAKYCMFAGRGNKEQITKQINRYKQAKIPPNLHLIQSGILMRERTPEVIDFCEQWHDELSKGSTRDQLAFVPVAYRNPIHHLTRWNYRTANDFIYTKHYKFRR